jgi:hypothetical protein
VGPANTWHNLIHGVVHELLTKFSQFVYILIIEGRFHRSRRHTLRTACWWFSQELSFLCCRAMPPDNSSSAQLSDEEFEEIGLGGVLPYVSCARATPHRGSRRSGGSVQRPNDCEMRFMVIIDPLNEEAPQIIGA